MNGGLEASGSALAPDPRPDRSETGGKKGQAATKRFAMKRVIAREIQQGFTPVDHLRIEKEHGEQEPRE